MTVTARIETNESSPFYYGWRILVVSMIGMMFSPGPMLFATTGVFAEGLEARFDASRGAIMFALTLNTVGTMIAAPYVGRLIDRFGVRNVLLPSLAILALLLALTPVVASNLTLFYIMIFLLGFVTTGTQSISYVRTLSGWFDKHRGLAIGMAASGLGLGYMVLPLLVSYTLPRFGWSGSYMIMGGLVLIVSLTSIAVVFRNSPSDIRDDSEDKRRVSATEKKNESVGLSSREALKTSNFWLISTAILLFSLILTGLVPHIVPLLKESGLSLGDAAKGASLMGLATFVGRISVGFLVDRFFAPFIAIFFFALATIGLFILSTGGGGLLLSAGLVMVGLGFGAESDLIGYLISRYFGLKAFGEIYGYMLIAFLIGAGFGPAILGFGFGFFGSYEFLLQIMTGLSALGCLIFLGLGSFPDFENLESSEAG